MSAAAPRTPPAAGFSLLEALVALAVLAFAAAMTLPMLRARPARLQLEADATRLASALRITRAAAMSQNVTLRFLVDPDRRTYGSAATGLRTFDPRSVVAVATSRAVGSEGGFGILFFSTGRSSGGDILLRLERAEARVRVIWATGHVVVE